LTLIIVVSEEKSETEALEADFTAYFAILCSLITVFSDFLPRFSSIRQIIAENYRREGGLGRSQETIGQNKRQRPKYPHREG
jgi:hypothetical protein